MAESYTEEEIQHIQALLDSLENEWKVLLLTMQSVFEDESLHEDGIVMPPILTRLWEAIEPEILPWVSQQIQEDFQGMVVEEFTTEDGTEPEEIATNNESENNNNG